MVENSIIERINLLEEEGFYGKNLKNHVENDEWYRFFMDKKYEGFTARFSPCIDYISIFKENGGGYISINGIETKTALPIIDQLIFILRQIDLSMIFLPLSYYLKVVAGKKVKVFHCHEMRLIISDFGILLFSIDLHKDLSDERENIEEIFKSSYLSSF